MSCTDSSHRRALRRGALPALFGAVLLASCAAPPPPAPAPVQRPSAAPAPAAPVAAGPRARNWDDYSVQMARRIVAANPDNSFNGVVPQPLLAIPVIEIELNGDGSIRNLSVLRQPSQARDTTQLALDAVRRAAPFGDVSHLPRPWKLSEAFLFRDDRKFKPRALDQ